MKRILDVGNCDPDHHSISELVRNNFEAEIVRTHGSTDALAALQEQAFDLIMVNRLMDRDGSSGLEIIKSIKTGDYKDTPVLMITNFAEHQELAMQAGAIRGFGKAALGASETLDVLRAALS